VEVSHDERLAAASGVRSGREAVQIEQLALDCRVDAASVDADQAAQAAFVEVPDVAVLSVGHTAQRGGGDTRELARLLRLREFLSEADELALVCRSPPDLVEQHGVGEEARDVLRDVGDEVDVGVPTALGVVVELDQPHHLAADHDRHAQGTLVAPLPVALDFPRGEALVAQRGDDERRPGGEGDGAGRVLVQIHGRPGVLRVDAVAAHADESMKLGALDLPEIDVVRVGRRHDALGDGLRERMQVGRPGDVL